MILKRTEKKKKEEEESGTGWEIFTINKNSRLKICTCSTGDTNLFSSHSLTREESFILSSSAQKLEKSCVKLKLHFLFIYFLENKDSPKRFQGSED